VFWRGYLTIFQNRKLRHLEGISLRNLAWIKSSRPRGQTIDDESIPTSLKSPGKLLAQKETKLEHSKSSHNLRAVAETDSSFDIANGVPNSPRRNVRQTLRRRSTLTWHNESPEVRQKALHDVVSERRLDTFFSLHKEGAGFKEQPFYISEVKEKFMNPDFQSFDLSSFTHCCRDDVVVVRVWAKTEFVQSFTLLVEAEIHLASLIRIGKTVSSN
jgi:UV radiation resistance-associated gene protein